MYCACDDESECSDTHARESERRLVTTSDSVYDDESEGIDDDADDACAACVCR